MPGPVTSAFHGFSPFTPNPKAQASLKGHGWLPHSWGQGKPDVERHSPGHLELQYFLKGQQGRLLPRS